MLKNILNAQSLFCAKSICASSFNQFFFCKNSGERKEEKEKVPLRYKGTKPILSFIYRDELGTGASQNCGASFCVRALESPEKGIAKSNSIFRKITIIKPFPCLLRGKDNNHKCNGDIKIDFVKSHF